jgi:hypothetical protein
VEIANQNLGGAETQQKVKIKSFSSWPIGYSKLAFHSRRLLTFGENK